MKPGVSDLAASYHRAAAMHLEAAEVLLKHCSDKTKSRFATEVIYLSGYVAECALKSALLNRTPARQHRALLKRFRDPKAIGHDLEAMRLELRRIGVVFNIEVIDSLRLIRSHWNTQMRYTAKLYETQVASDIHLAAIRIFRWSIRG